MDYVDEFTEMMNTEFDLEANGYLDKLLTGLASELAERKRTGAEPTSIRELAQRILVEIPGRSNRAAVGLAAALMRLQEAK